MAGKLFTSMSPEAAKFYYRIFNRVQLNLYAVKAGLFPTLFCETDDPRVMVQWSESLPRIVETLYSKPPGE